MNHQPLPWRITEATEKKGREIVDARGNTVAKLTALDLPNAELIVAAVNASLTRIKHITDPNQLEVGCEYWLVSKARPWARIVKECRTDERGKAYFAEWIWAYEGNNQAMDRWDIFGPLPAPITPDFEALKRNSQ